MKRVDGIAPLHEDGSVDGETWLLEHLKRQLDIGVNPILMFAGPPRSGKSMAAMRVLEMTRGLKVEDVIFPVADFVGEVRNRLVQHRKGVLLGDDFGTGMPAREWQSIYNRIGSLIFQSFGFLEILTALTVVDQEIMDNVPRRLYTVYVLMDPRTKDGATRARIYITERNPRTRTVYDHRPRLRIQGGGIVTLSGIRFGMPSESLVGGYQEKKRAYLLGLYDDLYQQVQDADVIGRKGDTSRARMVVLLWDYGQQLDKTMTEIAEDAGVRLDSFSRALRRAKLILKEPTTNGGLAPDTSESASP